MVVLALVSLTGCQGLGGGSPQSAGGTLSANPGSFDFGSVQVGKSAHFSETLTNTGGSAVTISQSKITGTGFSLSGLTLPTTLNPNQSVTFTVAFAPAATGSATGTLSIASDASNSPLNIALSGTGVAQGELSVSPPTLNFGTVTVGSTSALNAGLNATIASVTVSSASSSSSEFALSGITFPATIAGGQSEPFTVTFAPNASGNATATLTFMSDASNAPTVQSLIGIGKAPPPHWADLTWDAAFGAVSYNVYRKLLKEEKYKPINSGDLTTAYTDNDVTAGATYDYVVTAVDGQNRESGYSNVAEVTIPSP